MVLHGSCLFSTRPAHCKAFTSHLIDNVSTILPLADIQQSIFVM